MFYSPFSDAGILVVRPDTERMVSFNLGDGNAPIRIPESIHKAITLLDKWLYHNGLEVNDEVTAAQLSEGVKVLKDKGYDEHDMGAKDEFDDLEWEHVEGGPSSAPWGLLGYFRSFLW